MKTSQVALYAALGLGAYYLLSRPGARTALVRSSAPQGPQQPGFGQIILGGAAPVVAAGVSEAGAAIASWIRSLSPGAYEPPPAVYDPYGAAWDPGAFEIPLEVVAQGVILEP